MEQCKLSSSSSSDIGRKIQGRAKPRNPPRKEICRRATALCRVVCCVGRAKARDAHHYLCFFFVFFLFCIKKYPGNFQKVGEKKKKRNRLDTKNLCLKPCAAASRVWHSKQCAMDSPVSVEPSCARLFDYFAVVKAVPCCPEQAGTAAAAAPAYDGAVAFRWPPSDHPDTPFLVSLPFFCFPAGIEALPAPSVGPPAVFSFLSTADSGVPSLGVACRFTECVGDGLHLPVALCLLTRWPFFRQARTILLALHSRCCAAPGSRELLEPLIAHVLQGIPLPPAGRITVRSTALGPSAPISFRRPAPNNRISPLNLGGGLRLLLLTLSPQHLVRALTALMLEHPLVLVSSSLSVLTPACLALTALLFPFKWRGTLIPLLPAALLPVLDSPTPFCVGIHRLCLGGEAARHTPWGAHL
jgi:hypothetical protein